VVNISRGTKQTIYILRENFSEIFIKIRTVYIRIYVAQYGTCHINNYTKLPDLDKKATVCW